MSVRRVGEVLYVNDLAVAKDERLRPGCSLAVCRCPGERRRCTVSLYLDRIDSVVAFAKLPSLLDPEQERLTGLVLAVSGRHWLPEAQGALPAMPRNVVAHQGDKRLGVALRERVVGLPKNVGRHGGILTASTRSFQLRAAPPRTADAMARPVIQMLGLWLNNHPAASRAWGSASWVLPKRLRLRERVKHPLERPPCPQAKAQRRLREIFTDWRAVELHLPGERLLPTSRYGRPLLIRWSTSGVSSARRR